MRAGLLQSPYKHGSEFRWAGEVQMPCKVCGKAETVRSHIFPKTLGLEMRGAHGGVSLVSRVPGLPQSLPSTLYDLHMLCHEHEQATSSLDKYGVEFIRRAKGAAREAPDETVYRIRNPNPRRLSQFVASVLWRYLASPFGSDDAAQQRVHMARLKRLTFRDQGSELLAYAALTTMRIGSLEGPMIIVPFYNEDDRRPFWKMDLGGVAFMVALRGAGFGPSFAHGQVGSADPVWIPKFDVIDALAWPQTRDIFMAHHLRNRRD